MRNKIDRRLYAKEYEDDCDEILCYGVTFYKKRCIVKAAECTKVK